MTPRLVRPGADLLPSALALPSVFRWSFIGNFTRLLRFCRRRFWPRLFPQPLGDRERVDFQIFPPGHLIASLMQLSMMAPAERDRELVTDFEIERSGLGKAQVMRIRWLAAANKAGL